MRRFAIIVLLASIAAVPTRTAAVDLNGRWKVAGGPIVTITQTGSSISIPPYTGTVGSPDANGFTSYSMSWTNGTDQAGLGGRVMPSGNLMDGRSVAWFPPSFPEVFPIALTRCSCFDNNSVDGDGCDAVCQVEPCWTCVGDPSVCTPTLDGGACDDLSPCTTGETCTAGVCGGGTAVAPPCFDINGPWTRHRTIPGLGVASHTFTSIAQRGTDLYLDSYLGAIDPVTGAINVRVTNLNLFCGPFDTLVGSVAPDGLTYSLGGFVQEPQEHAPDHCDTFTQTELGDHCGDGLLEGTEACDDGNLIDGDGCSVQCAVEQCWTCAGTPSVCGPVGGGACDDNNECTISDTCAGDGSCAGTPDVGASCDDGSACTANDACAGDGGCVGAPVACGQCHACDTIAGCVPDPGAACDDGNACTPTDVCQSDGSCLGQGGISCEPCFGCDVDLGCVAQPKPMCKPSARPARSLLQIKQGAEDAKDRFNWRWKKGADVTLLELETDITVCAYDESGPTPALLFRAAIPDSGAWVTTPTGLRYKDYSGASDGLTIAVLKSGAGGAASARVKGKGTHLSDRPYPLPGVPVPLPLRVQLQGASGLCLETRHDGTSVLHNESGSFKAKGVP